MCNNNFVIMANTEMESVLLSCLSRIGGIPYYTVCHET